MQCVCSSRKQYIPSESVKNKKIYYFWIFMFQLSRIPSELIFSNFPKHHLPITTTISRHKYFIKIHVSPTSQQPVSTFDTITETVPFLAILLEGSSQIVWKKCCFCLIFRQFWWDWLDLMLFSTNFDTCFYFLASKISNLAYFQGIVS